MKKVSPRIFLHFAPCLAEFTKDEERLKDLKGQQGCLSDLYDLSKRYLAVPKYGTKYIQIWHRSWNRKDKLFISDALDQVINAQACVEALLGVKSC